MLLVPSLRRTKIAALEPAGIRCRYSSGLPPLRLVWRLGNHFSPRDAAASPVFALSTDVAASS